MTLHVRNLSHRYPHSGWVLREISARAQGGRVTAIIGPNAAGKSTLLRCAIGAIRPKRGSVQIGGSSAHRMSPARLAQTVAYVPQRSHVAADFTVRQIVELGRFALTPDDAKIENALRRLELEDLAARRYHELSVGQQQRVTLARAVAQLAPDGHLIADEPTSAMDLRHVHDTMTLLRELADGGATVLVAMHDLTIAAASADDIWLLDGGRLRAAGPVSEVMQVAKLEHTFNVMFERVSLSNGRTVLVSIAPGARDASTMPESAQPLETPEAADDEVVSIAPADDEVDAAPAGIDKVAFREPAHDDLPQDEPLLGEAPADDSVDERVTGSEEADDWLDSPAEDSERSERDET